MQGAMDILMLVCASVASLALGVLAAYGICRVTFTALRIHARSVAVMPRKKPQVARLI